MVLGATDDNQGVIQSLQPSGHELYARFKRSVELARDLGPETSDDDVHPELYHGEELLGLDPFESSPYYQMFPRPLVGHSYAADILNAPKPLGATQCSPPLTSPPMPQKAGTSSPAPPPTTQADGMSDTVSTPRKILPIRIKRTGNHDTNDTKGLKVPRVKPTPNLPTHEPDAAAESSTASPETAEESRPKPIPCCALVTVKLPDGKGTRKHKCNGFLRCDKEAIKDHFRNEHPLDFDDFLHSCPFTFPGNKQCNRSFANLEVFGRHLLLHFPDKPKVPCRFREWGCEKKFSRGTEQINRHVHASKEKCVGFEAWQEAHPEEDEPVDQMVEGPPSTDAVYVQDAKKRRIASGGASEPTAAAPRKKRRQKDAL